MNDRNYPQNTIFILIILRAILIFVRVESISISSRFYLFRLNYYRRNSAWLLGRKLVSFSIGNRSCRQGKLLNPLMSNNVSPAHHAFPKRKCRITCQRPSLDAKGVKVLFPRSSSLQVVLDFRMLAIRLRTLLHFSIYFAILAISFWTLSCFHELLVFFRTRDSDFECNWKKKVYKSIICFTWQVQCDNKWIVWFSSSIHYFYCIGISAHENIEIS